jgi:hypothetical protein
LCLNSDTLPFRIRTLGANKQKKTPRPYGGGVNPIQGELEETSVILRGDGKAGQFIFIMTDIRAAYD